MRYSAANGSAAQLLGPTPGSNTQFSVSWDLLQQQGCPSRWACAHQRWHHSIRFLLCPKRQRNFDPATNSFGNVQSMAPRSLVSHGYGIGRCYDFFRFERNRRDQHDSGDLYAWYRMDQAICCIMDSATLSAYAAAAERESVLFFYSGSGTLSRILDPSTTNIRQVSA